MQIIEVVTHGLNPGFEQKDRLNKGVYFTIEKFLMKLKEIYRSDRYYSICECNRVDGLVIDVTYGGIAMYSSIVELTKDEIEEFKQNGNLDDLAYKIGKGDAEILKRQLLPESENDKIEYVDTL